MDKHDGEPSGIERTDRDRENRQKGREQDTDPRGDRQYRQPCIWKRQDAATTRTDINIRVGLSTLSICPCGTYSMDWKQRIEGQISAKDVSTDNHRERLNDRQMSHTDYAERKHLMRETDRTDSH